MQPPAPPVAARGSLGTLARKWIRRSAGDVDAALMDGLEAELKLPRPLCQLLAVRGLHEPALAKTFLKPRIDTLCDPLDLIDVDVAVARLRQAIENNERILVHGDYDVDGICGAALFTRVLRTLGANVEAFVPHRLTDGYDLGQAGIRRAVETEATLLLTVDCGIVAHDAVEAARSAGIDVIVTDHHTPGARLPSALAVINPNRADCKSKEKGFVGAGVAFKLCQALVRALGGDEQALLWHLDLVAIATIADLAPLTGENRTLTHYGLKVLEQTRNPGLAAMLSSAALDPALGFTAGQISHALAPRLNAVGRMGAAARGVTLLLCDDPATAAPLAQETEEENRTRQSVDRATLAEALAMLDGTYDPQRDYAVVLAAEGWHPGVIGIVASRIVERIHRPVVLIALDAETGRGRGSARSIPAFDLFGAIDRCGRWLERYGGHHQAAGMEIRADRIDGFRTALNERARATLAPADLIPETRVDIDLRLADATPVLLRMLRHFGPFGMGNPSPIFCARGVTVSGYPREVGSGHLKLTLLQDGVRMAAIGFRMADRLQDMDITRAPIDVVFQLQENHYRGQTELQLKLIDFRMSA